jgi:hypothetical protein
MKLILIVFIVVFCFTQQVLTGGVGVGVPYGYTGQYGYRNTGRPILGINGYGGRNGRFEGSSQRTVYPPIVQPMPLPYPIVRPPIITPPLIRPAPLIPPPVLVPGIRTCC